MRKLLSILLFLVNVCIASAAPLIVKGKVSEPDGQPVVGAFVLEQGTLNGTSTSADGSFQLSLSGKSMILEVSNIGYKTVIVEAPADGSPLNIVMQEESTLLDETVVVAFGKQKKEAFTGSSATVKSETIAQRQISNPLNALNGQVAGLQMVESNSLDGDPTIRIRGIGSINASNSPLIVVDGMPYNGYWSDINPADVETITVLKDAASNALYGARGANGVIMITTKSAKRGRAVITFDAKYGLNQDALVDYETIEDPGQYYLAHMTALYKYYTAGKNEPAGMAFNHA